MYTNCQNNAAPFAYNLFYSIILTTRGKGKGNKEKATAQKVPINNSRSLSISPTCNFTTTAVIVILFFVADAAIILFLIFLSNRSKSLNPQKKRKILFLL